MTDADIIQRLIEVEPQLSLPIHEARDAGISDDRIIMIIAREVASELADRYGADLKAVLTILRRDA